VRMRCPKCLELADTRSTQRRRLDEGWVIWRRRKCLKCKKCFTTKEKVTHALQFHVEPQ